MTLCVFFFLLSPLCPKLWYLFVFIVSLFHDRSVSPLSSRAYDSAIDSPRARHYVNLVVQYHRIIWDTYFNLSRDCFKCFNVSKYRELRVTASGTQGMRCADIIPVVFTGIRFCDSPRARHYVPRQSGNKG